MNKRISLCILFIIVFSQAFSQVNLNNGLLAYYPFTGNFIDASGNGHNGTALNGTTFGTDQWGNVNSAAFFDGIDDWVSVPASPSISPSSHFTISFKFKTTGTYPQTLFSKSDYTVLPNNFQYQIEFNQTNLGATGLVFETPHFGTCLKTSGLADHYLITNNQVQANQWYCVSVVFDSGLKSIYVNGSLVAQQTVNVGTFPNSIDSCINGSLRFGTWWQNDPQYFSGLLDEVRIYNRALNIQEISAYCSYNPAADTVINKYAAVLNFDPCQNKIDIDTATDFNVGDTVLMIQMKGATIDTSNSPSFGNVIAYNGAGNYEYNTIAAKSGNTLTLTYKVMKHYDVPAGKVQIVRVPNYQNYTVIQPHTCMAWNGSKGGVFIMNVNGTLTLNNDIDVSGKGFRGGGTLLSTIMNCNKTDYYYPPTNNEGACKGEGITTISSSKMYGRGKLANGGGGGNSHNSGGAGGGNATFGGNGGDQYPLTGLCPTIIPAVGGIGGGGLSYSNTLNKIFMGGGGGAGHTNELTDKPGGNGGGIIIINTNTLTGNGEAIKSNGDSVINCTGQTTGCANDGHSGGGAGGTILLSIANYNSSAQTSVDGGNGADAWVYSSTLYTTGPGGGGGAGVVWISQSSVPGSLSINALGGKHGVAKQYFDSSWNAANGNYGDTLFNLVLPTNTIAFTPINLQLSFNATYVSCKTRQFNNQTPNANALSFFWDFADGTTSGQTSPQHTFPTTGTYNVMLVGTDSSGCSDTLIQQLIVAGGDTVNQSITTCDTSFTFGSQIISASGTYTHNFQNVMGCDSLVTLTVTLLKSPPSTITGKICSDSFYVFAGQSLNTTGTYQHTFTNHYGCDSLVTLLLDVGMPQQKDILVTTCRDTTFSFDNKTIDTAGVYQFTFKTSYGCDSVITLTLRENQQPFVSFSFTPLTPELNTPTSFHNNSVGCVSYYWDFGDESGSTEVNPVHQYTKSGEYIVCLTGWNDDSCSDVVCKRINAEVINTIDVPTAFTPNNDGTNDVLYVKGAGVKEFLFRIYNRWGQMIFESSDFSKGWDGTYKGAKQDMETFAFTLHATFQDGTTADKQGNITIMR